MKKRVSDPNGRGRHDDRPGNVNPDISGARGVPESILALNVEHGGGARHGRAKPLSRRRALLVAGVMEPEHKQLVKLAVPCFGVCGLGFACSGSFFCQDLEV